MTLKQLYLITSFLSILCLCATEHFLRNEEGCTKLDECSCALTKNAQIIDLHYAGHSDNGLPVFHYQSSKGASYFKYSPCIGLPCGGDLRDASVCIDASFRQPAIDIGTFSTAQFVASGGNVTLVYVANDAERNLTSRVHLKCSSDREEFLLDGNTSTVYDFSLYSICACAGLCPLRTEDDGMSVGTILLLIFFSALFVYFGSGCLYRRAVYGGETWSDFVPHGDFWFSLPSLIRDGYFFFISPCIGNRAEYRAYDQL